jgi:hypothetical protein
MGGRTRKTAEKLVGHVLRIVVREPERERDTQ